MPKKLTQAEFKNKLKKKNQNIKVIGKYIGSMKHIDVECKKCGWYWSPKAEDILQGHGCPKCSKKRTGNKLRFTQKQFESELKQVNSNIKIIGKYKGQNNRIAVECKKCNWHWFPIAYSLIEGRGCPKCSGTMRLTQKQFETKLKQVNLNIKVIGKYKSRSKHILVECKKCGCHWSPITRNLLEGEGCPICNGNIHLTQKQFKNRLKKINPNIKVIGKFVRVMKHINVKCKKCGWHWSPTPEDLLQGHGCPKCNISKGEQALIDYCKKHHYRYEWQYTIPDCRYKKPLPFDLAVFNSDRSLNSLIEYQGWQYFLRPYDGKYHAFYSNKELKNMHKRDKIKQQYCSDHHISLIYINHSGTSNKENQMSFIRQLVRKNLDGFLKVY